MKIRSLQAACLALAVLLIGPTLIIGQELKPVQLPEPQTDTGKPLMQVLKNRETSRAFGPEKLPTQVLSNMLWAAFGVNRQDLGKRTAPSARNWQEIDIYVATADGLYVYDAKSHALKAILAEDIRALTGRQAFVKDAPVNLVYVADFSKMGEAEEDVKVFCSAADTGFISQNVYLYCTSEGLATVVRGLIDKPVLEKAMGLRPDQKVTLSQTVGYPKK